MNISIETESTSSVAHLKAVESAVVFEGEDVVWDREEVALSCDEAADVHGFSWGGGHNEKLRSQRDPQHVLSVMKGSEIKLNTYENDISECGGE